MRPIPKKKPSFEVMFVGIMLMLHGAIEYGMKNPDSDLGKLIRL